MAATGADAAQIAILAVKIWRDLYAVLSPIIGDRGVCALYQRSTHLILRDHPWMSVAHEADLGSGEFDTLQTALAGQSAVIAAVAGDALLRTFKDLLTNLIGGSLTEQLFRLARDKSPDAPLAPGAQ